jgi:hypothetical protein
MLSNCLMKHVCDRFFILALYFGNGGQDIKSEDKDAWKLFGKMSVCRVFYEIFVCHFFVANINIMTTFHNMIEFFFGENIMHVDKLYQ